MPRFINSANANRTRSHLQLSVRSASTPGGYPFGVFWRSQAFGSYSIQQPQTVRPPIAKPSPPRSVLVAVAMTHRGELAGEGWLGRMFSSVEASNR